VHGEQLQPLAGVAMRLLAHVLSASTCKRNWSADQLVHSEKRKRLEKKRARDLVHVFQNITAVKQAKEAGIEFSGNVTVTSDEEEAEGGEQNINSDSQ
jgi:hypothetical protein